MSSLAWQALRFTTKSKTQSVKYVEFAQVADETSTILDDMNLLYDKMKVTHLSNPHFIHWTIDLLNRVASQIQEIETWLTVTLTESPEYSSYFTVNKSVSQTKQNAQSVQHMLRKAVLETAVNSKTLLPVYDHLETLTHILIISLEELHRHLQRLAREEAVYQTFFQEDL